LHPLPFISPEELFDSLLPSMGFCPGALDFRRDSRSLFDGSGARPFVSLGHMDWFQGVGRATSVLLHELGHAQQHREGLMDWRDGPERIFWWRGRRANEVAEAVGYGVSLFRGVEDYVALPWELDAWRRAMRSVRWEPSLLGADEYARTAAALLEMREASDVAA